MGSVENVLSRWGESLEADEMGRRGQRKMAHGLEMPILAENTSFSRFVARAKNITTTAHFVGSGRFQAVTPSREHVFHAPHVRF